jgi:hypothetical protein
MSEFIFAAIFEDGSQFYGGNDYYNTKWKEVEDKAIKTLFYRLPSGDYLHLTGYEQYYQFIEATRDLNGDHKDKVKLAYAYIMGRKSDKVICYKLDFDTNNVEYKIYHTRDTFIQNLNPVGWNRGI